MNENIMLTIKVKSNSMRCTDGHIIVDTAHFFNLSKTKEEIMENCMPTNGKEGLIYGVAICPLLLSTEGKYFTLTNYIKLLVNEHGYDEYLVWVYVNDYILHEYEYDYDFR